MIGPIPIGALQPPQLQDILRGLKAGELSPPIGMGEWKVLLRLEKLTPTRLDNSVREEMLRESLDSFLDDRVSKIMSGEGETLDPFTTMSSHDPTVRHHPCGFTTPFYRF